MNDTTTFAEAEVRLAESLPGYESRRPQQNLAYAIEQAIEDGEHLIAQAGCGVGKSLGYLIPAILCGQRVIVSTGTKALQNQIANKDLPFLAEHLGVEFTYAIFKGKSNYVCREALFDPTNDCIADIAAVREFVREHDEPELSGERDTLPELSDESWAKVTLTVDDDNDCGDACFVERAKRRAAEAKIVVVNHALLCVDALTGGRVLGTAELTIVDEVHELASYAAGVAGARISHNAVRSLVSALISGADVSANEAGRVLANSEALFRVLEDGEITPVILSERGDEWVALVNAVTDLAESAEGYARRTDDHKATKLATRAKNFAAKLADFVVADFADLVRWVEIIKVPQKGKRRAAEVKVLRSSPVDVGPFLNAGIWSERTAVLTSATVGEFDFAKSELGLPEGVTTLDVGSPFDFATQARLYVPTYLPAANAAGRDEAVVDEIEQIVLAAEGRSLVLFTSVARLRKAATILRARLPYTVLAQGEAPNSELAQAFAEEESSVLLGTKSFFTGVDFQGSTCSAVIIEKIPFGVPTEPLTKAKVAHVEAQGHSGFSHYSIPVASVILQQAVGRLIRTSTDRGVVAILDSRLVTKGYGRRLVGDLPPLSLVSSVSEVRDFLALERVIG